MTRRRRRSARGQLLATTAATIHSRPHVRPYAANSEAQALCEKRCLKVPLGRGAPAASNPCARCDRQARAALLQLRRRRRQRRRWSRPGRASRLSARRETSAPF